MVDWKQEWAGCWNEDERLGRMCAHGDSHHDLSTTGMLKIRGERYRKEIGLEAHRRFSCCLRIPDFTKGMYGWHRPRN